MSVAWRNLRIPLPVRRDRAVCGGTLTEMMLGLVVIGLTALLIFSALQQIRHRTKSLQWEEELKAMARIFADYRTRQGYWPANPNEMGARLAEQGWWRGSPFGGEYDWRPPGEPGQPALIQLTAFHPQFPLKLTRAELIQVDRRIDDGNLKTGRFRTGFNGWPVYQVRENP